MSINVPQGRSDLLLIGEGVAKLQEINANLF